MAKFFIDRPIVAMVISILVVIVGLVALAQLPIAQYPNIAPPEMLLTANYPGADAVTLEQSVATPIEQEMSGVDNMLYMYSTSQTSGTEMNLRVSFDITTDPNIDQVLVNMRYSQASSQLPQDVVNQGVTVKKSVLSPLALFILHSPKGTYDELFLSNYAYVNLNDPMTRVPGVGQVLVFGANKYAIRFWVNPDTLAKLDITVNEIVRAIQAQNTVNPAGQLGGKPVPRGQEFTYTVLAQGRLASVEDFENVVVRATPDGSIVRVRDVARVELGEQSYYRDARLNGRPAAGIAIFPLLGFSINTLSLFGLVLAIGLVVDDAIVVVEAVEHHIERGLSPRDAALKAMHEVSAPVVAIALVLAAVFVPTAFVPGITGRMYQQFALTIAVSVLISAFNALTLSPALSPPLGRTAGVMDKLDALLKDTPGVKYYTGVGGFSLRSAVPTTYNGFYFVSLEPWDQRNERGLTADVIIRDLNRRLAGVPAAQAFAFAPPAVPGIGTAGGVTFMLEDRAGKDPAFLAESTAKFLEAARKRPEFSLVFTTLLPSVPQLFAEVDRDKVLKQGIELSSVYQTLQAFLGGTFVNYFNRFGRVWQVYVQAEGDFRTRAENVGQFYVRNARGESVPLSTLVSIKPVSGPEFTTRFNEYRAAQINGLLAPGFTTRQGMRALEEVFAQTMSRDMGFDYSGMSFQEQVASQGVPPSAVLGFSVLVVFLIMAALYESWTLPFAVLLATPIAMFGALAALWLRGFELDVFSQIGLLMVIGLAAKNAILIVEFAKVAYEGGMTLVDAALEGVRVRRRALFMTSFAFILGCVPLWTAAGAGAVGRRILGTVVIGGVLTDTLIASLFISVSFYVSERFLSKRKWAPAPAGALAPIQGGSLDAPVGDGGVR